MPFHKVMIACGSCLVSIFSSVAQADTRQSEISHSHSSSSQSSSPMSAAEELAIRIVERTDPEVGAPTPVTAPTTNHQPIARYTRTAPAAPVAVVPAPRQPALPPGTFVASARKSRMTDDGRIGTNAAITFRMLDHAEDVNKKPLIHLMARRNGQIKDDVTFGGGITAIATTQRSNTDDKFGYLMRNPTSANQIGRDASEALIHSAQFSVLASLTKRVSAYVEMLYNPEQNMATGTITGLDRNQVVVRRAYLMWGDLDTSPVYFTIGKMDTPFGLNDTVSPFTNSTNWHAFSGLAYGAQVGLVSHGFHVRAMAIQGGSQFRAANVPVEGTNVPSRINNFALDANYAHRFGERFRVMGGASYTHGSAYCQEYPVSHFGACAENNPSYAVYGVVEFAGAKLLGEFAETTEVWPGTAVPDTDNPLSVFEAQKASAFTVGGRYMFDTGISQVPDDLAVSLEFSRFTAGDEDAPWERQDQYVLGVSNYLTPSLNMFGEYIHVDGFVPLNFLSGGNFPDGSTWSDQSAKTDVVLMGVQAAF